eukprot:CCRYP_010262-RF/>CCRYP_010262-RF protein AED:0.47 eAED:1.00 QI:0/0/0/1/0/0/2/0/103
MARVSGLLASQYIKRNANTKIGSNIFRNSLFTFTPNVRMDSTIESCFTNFGHMRECRPLICPDVNENERAGLIPLVCFNSRSEAYDVGDDQPSSKYSGCSRFT